MKTQIPALLLLLTASCGPSSITPQTTTATSETDSETTEGEPSETETETETETEDTGEETTFVPKQDHVAVECDPFAQDCADGEKCVPYSASGSDSWDANKCVPVTGDRQPGESCIYDGVAAGTDNCDASSLCWYVMEVEGELVGECLPFCLGSADRWECPDGSFCPISAAPTVNVCLPLCDPLAQDCDEGLGCYWASSAFTCVVTLDGLAAGEPCGFINDCAAGLGCFAEAVPDCAGSACCSPYCDLSLGDDQCAVLPGTSCSAFFEEGTEPPGYENLGVCISA